MRHKKRHVKARSRKVDFVRRSTRGFSPTEIVSIRIPNPAREGNVKPAPPRTQKRLRILDDDEIEAFYGRPHFTLEEREQYFALSDPEKALLTELRTVRSQTYFILQLGYFKAQHAFFVFEFLDVEEDAAYILGRFFPHATLDGLGRVDKRTRFRQRDRILELFGYRYCHTEQRQALEAKARQAARVGSQPIYVFRELTEYLQEQRVVAPGYSFMQETVGKALNHEQNRLVSIVNRHLSPADIQALKHLLEDPQGLHEITLLKREPKDFSLKEIAREIRRGEQIQSLYDLTQQLLPSLLISPESVKYYASLVTYYSVFRLSQLDESVVYLYLLCFAYYRYQKLHDNLINCLIYHVRRFADEAKAAALERVYTARVESNQDLQKASQVLKLFTDGRIAGETPFHQVQAQAFAILERPKLSFVADHMATTFRYDVASFQWEHIDGLAPQFKRHLRPLLLGIDFAASPASDPLMEALHFLQQAFRQGKSLGQAASRSFPLRFVPDEAQRYLYEPEARSPTPAVGDRPPLRLLVDRYEFLVYRLLCHGLQAGDVFCRESVRFRSLEDDLVDNQQWQQKETLIAHTGLALLKQPIQDHLAWLEQKLEERILHVNQRIASGENEYFQVKRRGPPVRWTLTYPRSQEPVNHPFFDTLPQVDIASVLHFAHRGCHFMEGFDHVLGRYARREPDDPVLTACLIAWGTNMGVGKMGEISDISTHRLLATSESFIRLETLREANDRISNAIAELRIFRQYDLGGALHSSSDGQKFETQIHTINARYASKYFGLRKGIVSYSLVANHVPLQARIIGANEHESHYVFDVLFNNTTDIQPQVHSTDTHGANEVNFALLYLFGYQFAPRYRDLPDKVRHSLYGFKHPSQYENCLLQPIRKLNTQLIMEEWENIQRIVVSLALKTTTQSIIIGKLSAHARRNKTRRALWEYDHIIRGLYLLDYIDSAELRQNVQHALNRGENYHRLRRAVSYANFGKLRFKTEQEQQLWNECSRLITHCIIYYNATLLSALWEHHERTGQTQAASLVKQMSPVAWQHINFHGRYEFSNGPDDINIEEMVQRLARIQAAPESVPTVNNS